MAGRVRGPATAYGSTDAGAKTVAVDGAGCPSGRGGDAGSSPSTMRAERHVAAISAQGRLIYRCPLDERHAHGSFVAPTLIEIDRMDLLERESCLTALADGLGRALKGSGSLALVTGEAGIGKTSLLQTFASTQCSARVLWGACDALFTPRPLAPLHDIGKVGIPDQILNKPGALTPDEMAEMRKHPTLGREVILKAEQQVGVHDDATLAMAKDIVYTHHERWDGTGYPQGLRGTGIPIPGRVMAIVDVYDAAVTRTLYRRTMSHDDTVKFIMAGKGTHFDPAVVDAFVRAATVIEHVSREESQ